MPFMFLRPSLRPRGRIAELEKSRSVNSPIPKGLNGTSFLDR